MEHCRFKAISTRVYFTFHIIGEPPIYDDDKPTWKAAEGRIFLTGD